MQEVALAEPHGLRAAVHDHQAVSVRSLYRFGTSIVRTLYCNDESQRHIVYCVVLLQQPAASEEYPEGGRHGGGAGARARGGGVGAESSG